MPADKAVQSMLRLVPSGGHVLMTCPYTEPRHIGNVYDTPGSRGAGNAFVAQSFSRADLDRWLAFGATVVQQEFWRYWTGDWWTSGEEIIPPEPATATTPHQYTCLLLRKN